ncbi:hypothetical protein O181_101700 [Austropuccinia psidii MF-1]|uniref:Uncharacterized protein n=1 Tax=Austropuccinia psidii MF-1 TaxID=1389203 RepID=A0A9Q3JI38_9BASI|nr:hypothetical protein [Austropuccinia psidii MF-1]
MGVIALNCLNLPPRLRFKPYYTCLSGIIPSPKQPDIFNTNNVLKPLVDELLNLHKGIKITTPKYTHGHKIFVRLVGLIGDVVATHKVAGFMLHSAKQFCSWCEINDHEQEKLQLGMLCNKRKVLASSWQWKETKTITACQQLSKITGIHWSQLNCLPYWDPVLCVSLRVIHNWYEGVLHHHFCFRWGFDTDLTQQTTMESGKSGMESKSMDLDDSDTSNEESKVFAVECLSNDLKQTIQNKIKDVIVPKGVSQITSKVGTAGNGRLKASEWRFLFSVYIPLVFLNSLFETEPQNHLLLVNTTALIECTEIVGAK